MTLPAAAILSARSFAQDFAAALPSANHHHANPLLHLLLSFGLIGVLLVSIVDSSFVPLPIPGLTDLMIVVLAAQHTNLLLLVGAATIGSFLGGAISYQAGHAGGMGFLEKHVPRASSTVSVTGCRPTRSSPSPSPRFCPRPCRSRPLYSQPERSRCRA